MFYLNSNLNLEEVYYKVDRPLNGLTTQRKGTTARWYSNKTSKYKIRAVLFEYHRADAPLC